MTIRHSLCKTRFVCLAMAATLATGGALLGQVQVAVQGKQPEVRALASSGDDNGGIHGPVMGYVFDSRAQGIQPIQGIPGASRVGGLMALGVRFAVAEISPRQDYALGVEAASGELRLVELGVPNPAARAVAGGIDGADRIVLSAGGDSAAVYDRDSRTVHLLAGLPKNPKVNGSVELSSLPGILTALAVNDRGDAILAAVSSGDAGSLYALMVGEQPRLVAPVTRVTAVRFLHNSSDAVAADYDANEVLLIRNVLTNPEPIVIASARDGVQRPVAVASSPDNKRIFAANSEPGAVAVISPEGGAPEMIACNCRATELSAVRGGAMFRLSSATNAPIMLLDASQPEARMLFIPPADGGSETPVAEPVLPRGPRGRVR